MKMVIKNEFGSFELGGGCNSSARIQSIVGLGLPTKESERINFSGQAGQLTKSVRDLSRTITVAFDFNGGQKEIERLYRILYHPVELLFTFGTRRRKIYARCINPQEVESIMYQNLYRYAIQFVCDNPFTFCGGKLEVSEYFRDYIMRDFPDNLLEVNNNINNRKLIKRKY